jgi:uncharacterized protein
MLLALVLASAAADVTAQTFITDVQAGRADQVGAALSDQMKAAITPAQLISTWKQATAPLGAFTKLELTKSFEKSGLKGFVFTAQFAQGALEVTTAVNPTNSKIEGFFIKPVSAGASAADAFAQTFVTDVREGRTEKFGAVLGDKLKAALTPAQLGDAWKQATASLGAFTKLEVSKSSDEGGLRVVILTASFEKGGLAVTVAVGGTKVEGFFLKPIVSNAAPAEYVKPAQFSAAEVSIGKAPFVLGGTITIPKGTGPFPAVVLVHGSGPHDRDETVGATKPFKDLAEGLASAGVVVLRYDKRTLIYGAKYAGKEITFDEEIIDDARAAIDVLKTRPEVDAKKIYVVGHSLGALFAPAVAKKGKGVAGIALLAPSSRKPWDIIPQQMKYLGVPEAQLAEVEKSFAEVKSGKAKGSVLNAPVSYWKAWAAFDGPAVAKSLGIPVLVLHGSRDYQVIDVDFAGWKKGLTGAKSAELVELPGLNHLFIAGEGPPSPKEYEVPSHVAPEVIARLVAFCR